MYEILIDELAIPPVQGSQTRSARGTITVSVIAAIEGEPGEAGGRGPGQVSVSDLCLEILRLAMLEGFRYLETAADRIVAGVLEGFPQILELELTVHCRNPGIEGVDAGSVGVRVQRSRPHIEPRQRKTVVRPRPM